MHKYCVSDQVIKW